MAQGFGVVDTAVKSITTVEEYIKVGMEIANEVAMDFVENSKEDVERHISEFRNVMLEFTKMERDLRQFQEAVAFVKQESADCGASSNLEEMLDVKLAELKSGNDESQLMNHEKVQDFNQRMKEALNPDDVGLVSSASTSQATAPAEDVEMTQQTVITRCPYTGKEMVFPMRNKHCKHNYDRDGIIEYIKQRKSKARCPLGGCANQKAIQMSDLEENKELRRYIERRKNKK